mmetsp:Transcript_76656/g.215107  ORF Transcript_76656/g.215107 Transcript_76656/m.215107 type:complete len:210 (-) Transcript_76656:555-1184(-)
MICCPANQRLSRARWQFVEEATSVKRTQTSPRVLDWSGQTLSTEPYFRHSCSTSASMSLKNSGSLCRLTCAGLNMPCRTMVLEGLVLTAAVMPAKPGNMGRNPPGAAPDALEDPCSFCMSARRSLESFRSPSTPLGPCALAPSSRLSRVAPEPPRARAGPCSPACMSLVAMPTFSSLPASWKPFMAVMASRASEAFLNCTKAKPLHLLV